MKDIKSLPSFLVIIFSCCFFTQITSLSPFYFGVLFFFIFMYLIECVDKNFIVLQLNSRDKILICMVCLLSFCMIENTFRNEIDPKYPFLIILGYFMFILSFEVKNIEPRILQKILKKFKFIVICIMGLEFVVRFYTAFHSDTLITSFYNFKTDSIMFNDTNEVGMFEVIMFGLLYFFRKKKIIKVYIFELILCSVFIFFTFSRAAMMGAVLLVLYIEIYGRFNLFLKTYCILAVIITIPTLILYFSSDGSFLTKIDIFHRTIKWIHSSDLKDFIFGVGLNKTRVALGYFGHNYVSLYLVEYGFIGLLLFIFFFILVLLFNHNTIYIILPVALLGLSYFSYYSPYLYFYLGLLYNIDENKFNGLEVIR